MEVENDARKRGAVFTGTAYLQKKKKKRSSFCLRVSSLNPRCGGLNMFPAFIWDDEATLPGKLSSSTIPREYHHSSIEKEGQRGMMGGWRKKKRGGGGGGGEDVKRARVREMFIVRERRGCVEEWSNRSHRHIPTAALIFFSFHLTLTRKWTSMPVYTLILQCNTNTHTHTHTPKKI